MKFYDNLIDKCKKYHGFYNRKTIDLFVKYATTCFEHWKDKVKHWMTFNEINMTLMETSLGNLYGVGVIKDEDLNRSEPCKFPEMKDVPQERVQALHNEFVASAKEVILTLQKNFIKILELIQSSWTTKKIKKFCAQVRLTFTL